MARTSIHERALEAADATVSAASLDEPNAETSQTATRADDDLLSEAVEDYYSRRFAVARLVLWDLLERFPKSPRVGDAYFWLGRMYQDEGEIAGAVGNYERGRTEPDSMRTPEMLLRLGLLYANNRHPALANARFSELRNRFPGSDAAAEIPDGF